MCVEQVPLCGRPGLKAASGESANTGTCFDPTGKWQASYWVTGFTLSCSMWKEEPRERLSFSKIQGAEAGREKQLGGGVNLGA